MYTCNILYICTYIIYVYTQIHIYVIYIYTYIQVPSDELIRRILSVLMPRHHARTSKGAEGRGGWKQRAICVECVSELLPNTESLANLAAGVLAVCTYICVYRYTCIYDIDM